MNPEHEECADGYQQMSVVDIAAMNIGPRFCEDSALLFLWTTWTHLLDGSAATVAAAWDFTPKTVVPWAKLSRTAGESTAGWKDHPAIEWLYQQAYKLQITGGHYVRNVTEPLVVCVRKPGRVDPPRMLPGLIVAPRTTHSRKPVEVYSFVETMTDGPYLELFARRAQPRKGWRFVGDQASPEPG